jgi:hypothetical protein
MIPLMTIFFLFSFFPLFCFGFESQVPNEIQLEHLKALSALYGSGSDLSLTLNSESAGQERNLTFIRPINRIGLCCPKPAIFF